MKMPSLIPVGRERNAFAQPFVRSAGIDEDFAACLAGVSRLQQLVDREIGGNERDALIRERFHCGRGIVVWFHGCRGSTGFPSGSFSTNIFSPCQSS